MKARAASVLAALLALSGALAAQPKLTIDGGLAFDFGELRTLVPVSRELRIGNEGSDTLHISNVSGSCGCTGTLLSESAIPPGGSGLLKITFDPAKFKGKVEKVVSMKTNDPLAPNPHITFSAVVSQLLEFEVSHVVITTPVDSLGSAVVTVRNASDGPIRITAATAAPADLAVQASPERLGPGETAELRCSIRPTKPGIVKGDITITTDHPLLPSVTLRYFVYAKSAGAKSASPTGH